jgi:hypothetical protein
MPSVLDNRRRLAIIGLAANCAVEAGSVGLYTLLLLSLDGVSLLDSRDLEGLEGLLSISRLGSLLFTAIWFIAWLYRAYGNALAMRGSCRSGGCRGEVTVGARRAEGTLRTVALGNAQVGSWWTWRDGGGGLAD